MGELAHETQTHIHINLFTQSKGANIQQPIVFAHTEEEREQMPDVCVVLQTCKYIMLTHRSARASLSLRCLSLQAHRDAESTTIRKLHDEPDSIYFVVCAGRWLRPLDKVEEEVPLISMRRCCCTICLGLMRRLIRSSSMSF